MEWNSNVLWGCIGLFGTIFFGFLFSYIFYIKSIKTKKLHCIIESQTLISHYLTKQKGLKIYYNKKNIKKLISTIITIENVGNDTIEGIDVAPSSQIRFSTSGRFLFDRVEDYDIDISNKNTTASLYKIDNSNIELSFDYLKPQDQIKVSLLHNGRIAISGDLKNGNISVGGDLISNEFNQELEYMRQRRRRINKLKTGILVGLLLVTVFQIVAIIVLFIIK